MGVWRYEPEDLPRALLRAVRWRFPGERLRAFAPCQAEIAGPGEELLGDPEAEGGLLGVTDHHVLLQRRPRPAGWFRVAAWTFAGVAAAIALSEDPSGLAPAAALAAASWIAGRALDALGVGGAAVGLAIQEIDRVQRWVLGVDPWGARYRLRFLPGDLERLLPFPPA